MKISRQAKRDAKALFQICKTSGLLDENLVRDAVRRVVEQKPRGYVAILHHFHRLVKLDMDRRTATIENAVEYSQNLKESIQSNLEKRYGPGLNTTFSVNPELIGGLRVRVGSDVYDGSVRARLTALAETF